MDTQSLREAALNAPIKQEDIATPFWPGTDGHVAIGDVPTDELTALSSLAKEQNGMYSSALICRALINKETGEQLFSDADRDMINKQGSTVIKLMKQLNSFFGFDTKAAIEAAKNA